MTCSYNLSPQLTLLLAKLLHPHGEAIQAGRRLLRMLGYSVRVHSQPQRRVVAAQYLGKLICECIGVGLGSGGIP